MREVVRPKMQGTFLSPSTCGFGRILALEANRRVDLLKEKGESRTKYQARFQQECYRQYKESFGDVKENFDIDFEKFTKKLSTLQDAINKWNPRKINEKKQYLETFSSSSWEKLSETRKSEHSFTNCKGCALRHAETQALFPVKSRYLLGEARKNPVFNAAHEVNNLRSRNGRVVKPSQRELKNAAKAMFDNMSSSFEKHYGADFAEVLSKASTTQLQNKSSNDIRSERRQHYRQFKNSVEESLKETAFLRYVQSQYIVGNH